MFVTHIDKTPDNAVYHYILATELITKYDRY